MRVIIADTIKDQLLGNARGINSPKPLPLVELRAAGVEAGIMDRRLLIDYCMWAVTRKKIQVTQTTLTNAAFSTIGTQTSTRSHTATWIR